VFGAGYSPVAPGTCGTLFAIPLIWLLAPSGLGPFWMATISITLVGIWAGTVADKSWGTHDSGRIVIDEVSGMFFTMAWVPRGEWQLLTVGFLLFRLFDVVKPFPIRHVDQHVGGGLGVMLDDVLAGLLASFCLLLVHKSGALAFLSF